MESKQMTNFADMTGAQLVSAFNTLAKEAALFGATSVPAQIKRFPDRKAGVKRCEALAANVKALKEAAEPKQAEADMGYAPGLSVGPGGTLIGTGKPPQAKTAAKAKAMTAAKAPAKKTPAAREHANGSGHPLSWYTEQYNALVPEAVRLGIKAKHHTSLFESKAKAEKQLASTSILRFESYQAAWSSL
jgi:hypothetical protein